MFGERSSKYKHFKHSKNAFNVFIIHRGVNVERKSGTIFQLETDQRMFSIVIWSFLIQSIIPHTKHTHNNKHMPRKKGFDKSNIIWSLIMVAKTTWMDNEHESRA